MSNKACAAAQFAVAALSALFGYFGLGAGFYIIAACNAFLGGLILWMEGRQQ